jgi:hypothetical protein
MAVNHTKGNINNDKHHTKRIGGLLFRLLSGTKERRFIQRTCFKAHVLWLRKDTQLMREDKPHTLIVTATLPRSRTSTKVLI